MPSSKAMGSKTSQKRTKFRKNQLECYASTCTLDGSENNVVVQKRQRQNEHEGPRFIHKNAQKEKGEEKQRESHALSFIQNIFRIRTYAPYDEEEATSTLHSAPRSSSKSIEENDGGPCANFTRQTYHGVWTEELHEIFVRAVTSLGGARKATPMAIKHVMNVSDLTRGAVSKHLQKYRAQSLAREK